MEKGLLLVISGFSGAGKGTLVKKLLAENEDYALSVSMTTRAPREGEREGVDYFYTDKAHFEEIVAQNGLIEYASYCGNYYGTPREYVESKLEEGKNVLLEIEIQGAMNIKKLYPDSLLLFVTPPSAGELERRLRERGTEDEATIQKRLARASEESEDMDRYDFLIVNDDLDACAEEVRRIVAAARRMPVRQKDFIGEIRRQLWRYR